MDQRTDVTELIPKALGSYWLIFFGGATVVAGLEFAYYQLPAWSETLGHLTPLDLTSPNSIMAWCLSTLFLLSAGVALINSRLGKRYDDPDKGDVWFWTAFAMVLLSLDMQVLFRETIRGVLIHVSGTPLYQNGDVWWLAVYAFVFGLIAIRLLQDMWGYPPACLLFSLSILGAIFAQLLKIGILHISETPEGVIAIQTTVEAFAVLLLFLSFLLFGRRQVLRDPQVAMRWFARVWKQAVPATKPTTAAQKITSGRESAVYVQALPPQSPTLEPIAVAPKSDRTIGQPKVRPVLDKEADDAFTLLKAS